MNIDKEFIENFISSVKDALREAKEEFVRQSNISISRLNSMTNSEIYKEILYRQIFANKIKGYSNLEGIDIDEIISEGVENTAIKKLGNSIKPEELTEDIMEIFYFYDYKGEFANPIVSRMYQIYEKMKNAEKRAEQYKTSLEHSQENEDMYKIAKGRKEIIGTREIQDESKEKHNDELKILKESYYTLGRKYDDLNRTYNELNRKNNALKEENESLTAQQKAKENENRQLRHSLTALSDFVARVKNSVIGKLFFNRYIKALPESMVTDSRQHNQSNDGKNEFMQSLKREKTVPDERYNPNTHNRSNPEQTNDFYQK